MAADGGGSLHDLVVQSWVIYARFQRMGWLWQAEDFVMLSGMLWYTAFVVTNLQLAKGGGGTLYLPGQFETFTPDDIASRVQFAKVEFASEQCMVNVVWTMKACMLIIYYRMTTNLKQQFWVKVCAVYTLAGFVAVQLTLFLNCRPFSGYWTLPPPHEECATYFRFEVIQAVFNISSDLAILIVIMPTLWRMSMSLKEKVPVLFIFSMGFFLIICAIVSKFFTFRDIFDTSYQFWYLRESSVGVYITNLPYIWSFLRRTMHVLHTTTVGHLGNPLSSSRKSSASKGKYLYSAKSLDISTNPFQPNPEHQVISTVSAHTKNNSVAGPTRSGSEERIFSPQDMVLPPAEAHLERGEDIPLNDAQGWNKGYRIQMTTEIHIDRER
ncbi:hypothetical protein PISL3812_00696 [Talaromyces islandicus]|uniref:Rhodopsin domain-containing protein n=1 Tax=Talaromyces islandicus TaxID=28573 RepID=A0A0U1LK63_TALIS|nr:hypothetical protein PISL3812_00696 [Talaromyces islandicus]